MTSVALRAAILICLTPLPAHAIYMCETETPSPQKTLLERETTIVNTAQQNVQVHRIDSDGKRVLLTVLSPKEKRQEVMPSGHTWVATDVNGYCRMTWTSGLSPTWTIRIAGGGD